MATGNPGLAPELSGRLLTGAAGRSPGWSPGQQPQREMDSLSLVGPVPPALWGRDLSSPRLLVSLILSGAPFPTGACILAGYKPTGTRTYLKLQKLQDQFLLITPAVPSPGVWAMNLENHPYLSSGIRIWVASGLRHGFPYLRWACAGFQASGKSQHGAQSQVCRQELWSFPKVPV